jgi:antitoxin ParD1/3/4
MNVNLPDDLTAFVAEQAKAGSYRNQSEVVREALRLMRRREAQSRTILAALDESDRDIDEGRTKDLTAASLRAVARRAAKRAQRA